MKCERCGQNEVNFYYTSNINGKVTEKHLCSKCAEELGYTKELSGLGSMKSMFGGTDSFFGRANRMFGDMFGSFFGETPSLWGRSLFEPMDRWAMPAHEAQAESPVHEQTQQQKPMEQKSANPELVRRREINALREELNTCIREENFEKAAELRDKIHALENSQDNK